MARIFNAMTQYPEMVAGDDRFCTVLMKAFQGRLIGKVGADGVYAVGLRKSEQTRQLGATGALGISVKIEDGNLDVLYAAVAEILEQLGVATPEVSSALIGFRQGKIVNTAGVVTGGLAFPFRLRAA
ncbi:l-asparaginase II domain-containing protein [Hirsutella rhossiliensis]|uniref:L-asparaginase II domain-containing protein n=1 Tax=Hirsutella rhossiliensis TaxID=111463 RepID=A0A9P8SNH0_9HYPO|nr:l-asparaginase II domain-containing protein [Hirsutella rhossiliensis]KAH0968389.1 l-asparaginase II domain-containing protein [Hirsutella rhossiliensis]